MKALSSEIDSVERDPPDPDKTRRGTKSPFHVPFFLHALGSLSHRFQRVLLRLGRLESSQLAEAISQVAIRSPIYICGLARSGSTLLHEVVCSHPGVATHRAKDYPVVFTPYWWRRATPKTRSQPPRERLHRDGVMVTAESPEALEEMLWMAFFPRCHDPSKSNLLGGDERHAEFEKFYDLHLRKLLLAEKATRYAAKANYHVARLLYLLRLYPDARFLIPVRAPVAHIASLLRQQRWFSQGQHEHPRALTYMQRSGHFEFGLDRRPINLGDQTRVDQIRQAWADGEEVRGLAMYWNMIHRYLVDLLAANDQLRNAALVVRFEDLCASPAETLRKVFDHCHLAEAEQSIERYAAGIRTPTDYEQQFSPAELAMIREETAEAARLFGY